MGKSLSAVPKVPDDSAMSESVKALFTSITMVSARPKSLHIPHYDDETVSLCSKMKIKKKDNPSKYGPFCGGCKRKYYTDGRN